MGRVLLRGAHVVTMAPSRPDAELIDVLVDGDQIRDFGMGLDSGDAEVVDVSNRVIIPGLVNAHLHTWQTAMRFAGADWSLPEYVARAHGGVAHHYRPSDMHIGTLAGALTQIDGGVTTIGDWCHNCLTPDHADAAIDALRSAGVRAVFLHGTPHGLIDRPHDVREIDRLLGGSLLSSGLLSLGMAVKGPQQSKAGVAVTDLRAAAERGLVASMHQSVGAPGPAWQTVSDAGLWGPRVNIAHGAGLTAAWIERLVGEGVSFTATTENELSQGHCTDLTRQLLRVGSAPSLGSDTEIVTPGDVLAVARMTLAQQRGLLHDQAHAQTGLGAERLSLSSRDALSWATVAGARALGLADRIGHLAPGMQADLVVIDARMLNLWPSHDPVATALYAHPGNVEAVMIAGAWRKRNHRLVHSDIDGVKEELRLAGKRLIQNVRSPGAFERVKGRAVQRAVSRKLRQQASLDPGGPRPA